MVGQRRIVPLRTILNGEAHPGCNAHFPLQFWPEILADSQMNTRGGRITSKTFPRCFGEAVHS